jgi:hypothetical protein
LTERLGEEGLTLVVWLKGKVAAGQGGRGGSCGRFERVRRVLQGHGLAFNFALVGLELELDPYGTG